MLAKRGMSKRAMLIVCASAVALVLCSTLSTVEAHGFRHEAVHRARLAHALARREMALKSRQAKIDAEKPHDDSSMVASVGQAFHTVFSSVVVGALEVAKSVGSFFGDSATTHGDVTSVESAEKLVEARLSQPKTSDSLCVAGICGLNLVFVSIWAIFAACFAIVYVMDKRRKRSLAKLKDDPPQQQAFVSPDATSYYQEVTGSRHAMTLRRRPGKVVQ